MKTVLKDVIVWPTCTTYVAGSNGNGVDSKVLIIMVTPLFI